MQRAVFMHVVLVALVCANVSLLYCVQGSKQAESKRKRVSRAVAGLVDVEVRSWSRFLRYLIICLCVFHRTAALQRCPVAK